jgi:hypothetical protein
MIARLWSGRGKICGAHCRFCQNSAHHRILDFCNLPIDSLLVFVRYLRLFISYVRLRCLQAGLFSAVLTAFAVESYQMLSTDPAETSAVLLQQIIVQLNDLVTHAATPSPLISPPLHVRIPNSVVRINSKHIR